MIPCFKLFATMVAMSSFDCGVDLSGRARNLGMLEFKVIEHFVSCGTILLGSNSPVAETTSVCMHQIASFCTSHRCLSLMVCSYRNDDAIGFCRLFFLRLFIVGDFFVDSRDLFFLRLFIVGDFFVDSRDLFFLLLFIVDDFFVDSRVLILTLKLEPTWRFV